MFSIFISTFITLIMVILYNKSQLLNLKKSAKLVNLLGFSFGAIKRIRELEIQKRIQQRKKSDQNNNNKQHGINVRNLKQIQTHQDNQLIKHDWIATVNIRSVKHKEDLLQNVINDLKIGITVVTETWLQDTNKDTAWIDGCEYNKSGLQIYTHNRQKGIGGGIAIITSSNVKVNKLNTTNFNSFEHAVW